MKFRALRTAAVSILILGGTVAFSPASHAQETTTSAAADTAAPAETSAASAETTVAATAETTAAEAPAETTAAAPEGAVAAGGGFLSKDNGGSNALPIGLAAAGVLVGAGFVASRRRKA